MRALFDINVLLDVIERREAHYEASRATLDLVEDGMVAGHVAAHSLPTVFYLVERHASQDAAYGAVRTILALLDVVSVDGPRLRQALALGWGDFEDAIQAACAGHAAVDVLVTRDPSDYGDVGFTVEEPDEFIVRPEFAPEN